MKILSSLLISIASADRQEGPATGEGSGEVTLNPGVVTVSADPEVWGTPQVETPQVWSRPALGFAPQFGAPGALINEIKQIKQMFIDQNESLEEIKQKLTYEMKENFAPWHGRKHGGHHGHHGHHANDHFAHHTEHHPEHHVDHPDHAKHHMEEGDFGAWWDKHKHQFYDESGQWDKSKWKASGWEEKMDSVGITNYGDGQGAETDQTGDWWEMNKWRFMDKQGNWDKSKWDASGMKEKMKEVGITNFGDGQGSDSDTKKNWWSENKHRFMNKDGSWDKSAWKDKMAETGITNYGDGQGETPDTQPDKSWEKPDWGKYAGKYGGDSEKWAGKMQFFGKMKEEMGDIDWKKLGENMPWEKIKEKVDYMTSDDYQPGQWKEKMAAKKAEMYQTTLAAHRTEMSQFLLEASHRNTVDSLAKVTKELPEGTTCVNMAWGLSCLMEQSLEKHMYDPTADTPSQFNAKLFGAGILFPSGAGHQSVVPFPNASEAAGVPTVGTVIHPNFVVTSGQACFAAFGEENVQKWANYIDLETFPAEQDWGTDPMTFFNKRPGYDMTSKEWKRNLFAIELHGQTHRPVKKHMLPATKEWIDVKSHFEKVNSTDDFVPAFAEFTKNTVCVLEFEEQLPIWSACNALDNGQLGKAMVEIKHDLAAEMGHQLGNKYDMPEDERRLLTSAYENIVHKRYMQALSDLPMPCLYKHPKQCFLVSTCSVNGISPWPVKMLDWDTCEETYAERCKKEYFVLSDKEMPEGYAFSPSHGAPLLCAENGSVSFRGVLNSWDFETGVGNFIPGDYNLMAIMTTQKDMTSNWADMFHSE